MDAPLILLCSILVAIVAPVLLIVMLLLVHIDSERQMDKFEKEIDDEPISIKHNKSINQ